MKQQGGVILCCATYGVYRYVQELHAARRQLAAGLPGPSPPTSSCYPIAENQFVLPHSRRAGALTCLWHVPRSELPAKRPHLLNEPWPQAIHPKQLVKCSSPPSIPTALHPPAPIPPILPCLQPCHIPSPSVKMLEVLRAPPPARPTHPPGARGGSSPPHDPMCAGCNHISADISTCKMSAATVAGVSGGLWHWARRGATPGYLLANEEAYSVQRIHKYKPAPIMWAQRQAQQPVFACGVRAI